MTSEKKTVNTRAIKMTRQAITRRSFVTAAGNSVLGFTFLPSHVFGANERLNVAAIGVGGKGASDIADASAAGCNIVALCDVDEERAGRLFAGFPAAGRYKDFRVMLEKRRDIDAVIVSTPDHTHAVAAIMAMKLGKHVYCQKPLAHSIHEARTMAQVAAETGVATQMGNQAHAGDPMRRTVEAIRAGIIGKVREAHIWSDRPIWPQGMARPVGSPAVPATLDWDLWLGPAPARPYHPAYAPFNWRGWWDFGTGALGDMGCHVMDMAYWALELGHPTSVEAISEGATRESLPHSSVITYEFPARGEQPPVKLVWYDGGNLPPEGLLDGEDPGINGTIFVGDKGTMLCNRSSKKWVVKPTSIMDTFQAPPKTFPRVENEDVEWVAACKGGPPALSNFSLSGPFTEVVLLGNLAIRADKKILWDSGQMKATHAPELDQFIRREYRKGWTL
jgi:predicted dehydrogenase